MFCQPFAEGQRRRAADNPGQQLVEPVEGLSLVPLVLEEPEGHDPIERPRSKIERQDVTTLEGAVIGIDFVIGQAALGEREHLLRNIDAQHAVAASCELE